MKKSMPVTTIGRPQSNSGYSLIHSIKSLQSMKNVQ